MSLTKSSFTKRNACKFRTKVLTRNPINCFSETIIAKQMIKSFLEGKYEFKTLEDIEEKIRQTYFDKNGFNIQEIQISTIKVLSKCLYRFMNSFKFTSVDSMNYNVPIYLDLSDWISTHFKNDNDIKVEFTFVRKDIVESNKSTNIGTIEGVVLRTGKPDLSETLRGANNSQTDIWLHLMRLALRKYADSILLKEQSVNITASYYYLRKTTDKSDEEYENDDYFSDKKGIRQQKEIYKKIGGNSIDSELDLKLKELLSVYANGYSKSELDENTDCKGCPNYISCYFTNPPKLKKTDEDVNAFKSKKNINQDDYQKKVTRYRYGTGIVDAPPGSGKTEITTERTVCMALEVLDDLIKRYENGENVDIPVNAAFLCKQSDGLHANIKELNCLKHV